MPELQRVVATGFGLVTAIGLDETTVWENLRSGRPGIRPIRAYDLAANEVTAGGEVDAAELDRRISPVLRRTDRALKFALEAARQALTQAGRLDPTAPAQPQDIASLWGFGIGPTDTLSAAHERFREKGPRGMRPSTIPSGMFNAVSAATSIHFKLTGTNYVIVSACTSSTNALGVGFRMIRHGLADAVLCGGVETPFSPPYYGSWHNLGVLSTVADPARAVRPFSTERSGTLLGEGAGAILLESLDAANRRGARIRGEIVGYGESSDATHITGPSAAGQARAIRAALASAGVAAEAIGHINAHGTGTLANDATESQAILDAFGPAAATAPIGATKSYFGHTLGASGVIETIGTLLALEHRLAPPNLLLDPREPAPGAAFIGPVAEPIQSDLAMKNSFGFGGGNAVLILRRFS